MMMKSELIKYAELRKYISTYTKYFDGNRRLSDSSLSVLSCSSLCCSTFVFLVQRVLCNEALESKVLYVVSYFQWRWLVSFQSWWTVVSALERMARLSKFSTASGVQQKTKMIYAMRFTISFFQQKVCKKENRNCSICNSYSTFNTSTQV